MSLALNKNLLGSHLLFSNQNYILVLKEMRVCGPNITDDEVKELFMTGKATINEIMWHINDSKSIEMLVWFVENVAPSQYFPAYGIWMYRGFKNFYQQTYNIVMGNMKVSTSNIDIKYIIGTYIKRTPKNSREKVFKKELEWLGYECVNSKIEQNWETLSNAGIIMCYIKID